ncbi:hypothetical protein T11_13288 [Trichinella zimbabwensis]|uniref:Uncharacterized protein n=1 Tax=Trichinella zimbabwensis TaxID=268475 RepID=A0A0V1HXW5_9BILA|nr:hypothetical protein T11_13288 [Trichinella zimbabwensis]
MGCRILTVFQLGIDLEKSLKYNEPVLKLHESSFLDIMA